MTSSNSSSSRIEVIDFKADAVESWLDKSGRHHDWPIVYLLHNTKDIYVGESVRAKARFKEHLTSPKAPNLKQIRVVINDQFNRSACHDLESRLIALLHADGKFTPVNRNDGQLNSNYFERDSRYQPIFDDTFQQLRKLGILTRSVAQIENLNMFKLSPFKALTDEQLSAAEGIVEGLLEDLQSGSPSLSVVQGAPGTGKTILAIYILKLLSDIQRDVAANGVEEDGMFSPFFEQGFPEVLESKRLGFVVPQKSLRATVKKVFKATPGLRNIDILSPYTVAGAQTRWDVLVVDETHRLTHRGSGATQGMYKDRNKTLFGSREGDQTAIDWIVKQSDHQVFLLDGLQTVRPADVPASALKAIRTKAQNAGRHYSLESQIRVAAGDEYLNFARSLLTNEPLPIKPLSTYDLRFFDDLGEMRDEILRRDAEVGLSRLVAGYAWKWISQDVKGDDAPYDIELDGAQLRWNRKSVDWIASEGSEFEVGSVHTVQGYDLNYAGVIIGPDIAWNEDLGQVCAVRGSHFDREVRSFSTDENILEYIANAYYVLLTRGMRGTYVYVCDPKLRARVKELIQGHV